MCLGILGGVATTKWSCVELGRAAAALCTSVGSSIANAAPGAAAALPAAVRLLQPSPDEMLMLVELGSDLVLCVVSIFWPQHALVASFPPYALHTLACSMSLMLHCAAKHLVLVHQRRMPWRTPGTPVGCRSSHDAAGAAASNAAAESGPESVWDLQGEEYAIFLERPDGSRQGRGPGGVQA